MASMCVPLLARGGVAVASTTPPVSRRCFRGRGAGCTSPGASPVGRKARFLQQQIHRKVQKYPPAGVQQAFSSETAPQQQHTVPLHESLANFARPHTILGTIVSVSSVTVMAWQYAGVLELWSVFVEAAKAIVASVLMNVAIVGINQVYDKKLDRVNKPYLPMANGAFSSDTALAIIAVCTTCSLILGVLSGSSALLWALVLSLILGMVYSVDYPGLRWKRSPILAASCVLIVRAVIVQLGFFAHALGSFMTVYGIVIALFKDLPDVEGDSRQDVRTLSVRLGPSFVFKLCLSLLSAAYASVVMMSVLCSSTIGSYAVGVIHLAIITTLLIASRRVDVDSSASLYDYYMFIWKAFYLEYFLLPFCTFA